MKPIYRDEFFKLLDEFGNVGKREHTVANYKKIATLLFLTGSRINEILQMNLSDIKSIVDKGELKIFNSKNRSTRLLMFSDVARELIREVFKDDLTLSDEYKAIRVKNRPKQQVSIKSYTDSFNLALSQILDNTTSHDFRRGYITKLYKSEVKITTIAKMVGHKSVANTYRYVEVTDEEIKEAWRKIV